MFKRRFHEGIANGSITRTIRNWKRIQAKEGGFYEIHPIGSLEVISIEICSSDELTGEDVILSGFKGKEQLIGMLKPTSDSSLYRIDFKYIGYRQAPDVNTEAIEKPEEIEKLAAALALRDRNSKVGPWTDDTIVAIDQNPGMSASNLSEILEREKSALKQDVRKLKKLGLTISLGTGYRLSERGISWLNTLD